MARAAGCEVPGIEHLYRAFKAVGFAPRSVGHLQRFYKSTVGPFIIRRSKEDMEQILKEVDELLAAFDAAHSSVRDAEQSTAVVSDLRTGLIV